MKNFKAGDRVKIRKRVNHPCIPSGEKGTILGFGHCYCIVEFDTWSSGHNAVSEDLEIPRTRHNACWCVLEYYLKKI